MNIYGPLIKADCLKQQILNQLEALNTEIHQEKTLGDHIKINILPTPYKLAVEHASEKIKDITQALLSDNNIDDMNYHITDLKHNIQTELNEAFLKTKSLFTQLHQVVHLRDIKQKLKVAVQQKVKQAIQINNDEQIFNDVKRKLIIEQKLKKILKEKKRNISIFNSPHKELEFIADCLVNGQHHLLQEHHYFKKYPEYLRQYHTPKNRLKAETFKTLLNIHIGKIADNLKNDICLEKIYDNFINYIHKLENISYCFPRSQLHLNLKKNLADLKANTIKPNYNCYINLREYLQDTSKNPS